MALAVTDAICRAGPAAFFADWQALSGAALLASVSIIVFLYLVNRFFQNAEGTGWAKLELYEVFVTVVIMVGVFAASELACSARAAWVFPGTARFGDVNIYEASVSYLDGFSSKIMGITTVLYGFYAGLDLISSMQLAGRPLFLGSTIQPTGGFAVTIKPGLTNAFNMLIIAFIINKVQIFLIDFLSFGFIKYYLPIGLFLRSFTPTRRIGGTIIAIALGFLFIYPFLIILQGEVGLRPLSIISDELINFRKDISALNGQEFVEWWRDSISLLGILDFIGVVFRSAIGLFIFGLLYFSANAAGYAFLVGLFFPAFNTLILVTTIRYLSKSMGEEIDVTNLTRLI